MHCVMQMSFQQHSPTLMKYAEVGLETSQVEDDDVEKDEDEEGRGMRQKL